MDYLALSQLRRVLEDVPRERFNMDHWYFSPEGDTCQFAACAIGWACLDPWFKAKGLELKTKPLYGLKPGLTGVLTPHWNGGWGFTCLAAFFDITYEEALWLFDPATYTKLEKRIPLITPRRVMRRIDKMLNGGNT